MFRDEFPANQSWPHRRRHVSPPRRVRRKRSSWFRYPGGKSKHCRPIIEELEQQAAGICLVEREYREPFFGGGSIGIAWLTRHPEMPKFWMNDQDIGIASLWNSVILYPEDLQKLVRSFPPSVEAFYSIKKELLSHTTIPTTRREIVELGFKKLVIHQISYSGLGVMSGGPLGGKGQKSKDRVDSRWKPNNICWKIGDLHALFASVELREGRCTSYDFRDVLKDRTQRYLDYFDPPYYAKGGELYQHSFTDDDHRDLADCLEDSPHRWVLSYDDCPEIRSLYQWADVRSLDVRYSITGTKNRTTKRRESTTKPELLICPQAGRVVVTPELKCVGKGLWNC